MKLNNEQEVVCKVFSRRDSLGYVHCFECPMELNYRDCACLKNMSKEHAIKGYDWDGSLYPRLKGKKQDE